MANYTYLLKHFQAGDRILLYARGKNGQGVYRFLREQPQFQITGFVDRNADTLTDAEVPVYRPDQLKAIPPEAFDKIMITVIGQEMGEEIYRIIRESGVPQEKIVAPYTYIGPETEISEEEFLSDQVRKELRRFIDGGYGNLLYFRPLIQSLKGRKKQKEETLLRAKAVSGGLPPLDNIVFLHILYEADIFDAELMRRIMACLLQIDRPELRQFLYSVWNDTTRMCFLHSGYLFPEFYNMRKELLEKICGMYGFSMDPSRIKRSGDGHIRKIGIVYGELWEDGGRSHIDDPRTLQCVQWSNIFVSLGYEVQVLTIDPRSYLMGTPVFQSIIWQRYDTSADFAASYQNRFLPQVSFACEDACDLRERFQSQLDRIAAYAPDLIFDMSDEQSLLSCVYSRHFPTVYMPSRGFQSSIFFTYTVMANFDVFMEENRIYHSIDPKKVIEAPICLDIPAAQNVYGREQYSLAAEDFVLVTVGHRLNAELSKDFIDVACKKLLSCPDVKWLIVGSENEYLSEAYRNLLEEQRVIYIAYEDDLPALYQICNVYLNPRRQGGATSVCWAMYHIPIAMARTACDQAATIGLENMIDGTPERVMDYVLEMKRNPDFYAGERHKFRQRILYYAGRQTQEWKDILNTLEERLKMER